MRKAILISLSPYWYYLIGEGIKKIEVRKTRAKDHNWNKKVECYMTKDKKSFNRIPKEFQEKYKAHFGKVGMQFVCDKINEFHKWQLHPQGKFAEYEQENLDNFLKATCLTFEEVCKYRENLPYYKPLYGWHISQLKIYDKPKELSEFRKQNVCYKQGSLEELGCWESGCTMQDLGECDGRCSRLTRPPQSWGYVEELKE